MNAWAVKALSYAGRSHLIKSVITGLINFWIQTFILPKGCVSRLEALCARFLWFGKTELKKGARVRWEDVCLPRKEGGLGIRRITDWNKALCLKLFWLLHSNESSLWVKWHLTHNIKSKSIWEIKATPRHSWTWRAILSLRPLAAKFLISDVRNGGRTSFWFDNWSPFGPLIRYIGEQGPSQMRLSRDRKVAHASNAQGWTIPLTRSPAGIELHRFLGQTEVPREHLGPDLFGWKTKSSTTKAFSASNTWEEIRRRCSEKHWVDVIWFNGAIPAHAFNMWIAQLNRLPTRQRLHFWDNTITDVCCVCRSASESREHLFLLCTLWRVFGRRSFQD